MVVQSNLLEEIHLQKILNSPREVREVLAVDLIACNNYKNGLKAIESISCPCYLIFGDQDKMIKLEKGMKFANLIDNSKNSCYKKLWSYDCS